MAYSSQSIIQNIIGGWSKSDIRLANLSDSLNLYQETQGDGASASAILRSIRGTTSLLEISGNPVCRGLFQASRDYAGNPVLFAVFGNKVYVIRSTESATSTLSYSAAAIGQINNLSTPVGICETGGEGSAHPHLVVVDGAQVYAVDTTLLDDDMTADWRSIDLPYRVDSTSQRIQPTHCAYAYGYLIVNDAGTDGFYQTYQYPFETTTSAGEIDYDIFMVNTTQYKDYGFVTYAEWQPDNLTALISNGTYIYTFGPKSTQIFTFNDDVDCTWTSPTNTANMIGIKAVRSLARVGDLVFFLGASDIGQNGIYYWSGNTITKVSSPDIEREIDNMSNASDAIGQCWTENGHIFYAISFITDDETLVYDGIEKLWHRRSSKDATTNLQHYWRPQFATLHDQKLFFGTNDGNLIYLSDTFEEYDGRPMIRMRRSGALYNNYSPFYADAVHLVINNGDFLNNSISPRIMLRYAWDNGEWSNEECGLLGQIGEYGYNTDWYTLGSGKVLTLEISCSDPVNFAILNGKIQSTVMDVF